MSPAPPTGAHSPSPVSRTSMSAAGDLIAADCLQPLARRLLTAPRMPAIHFTACAQLVTTVVDRARHAVLAQLALTSLLQRPSRLTQPRAPIVQLVHTLPQRPTPPYPLALTARLVALPILAPPATQPTRTACSVLVGSSAPRRVAPAAHNVTLARSQQPQQREQAAAITVRRDASAASKGKVTALTATTGSLLLRARRPVQTVKLELTKPVHRRPRLAPTVLAALSR